ncbi:MAG: malto-oligosyltrehalose synthase [Dehalococcoidia bacterium]|nr:malto-oligosyltrehalose synthase [Dehalococcoidia bacterium]
MSTEPAEPIATYRLQLRPGFGFAEAAEIVPYLAGLGVSHIYTSPALQAAPGSTHGYDIVDYSRLNDELGGRVGQQRLSETLARAGIGWLMDTVPNHMAIGHGENSWWWDVLENGQASRYAGYFDVDWDPPEARLRNTVLLPILGTHYGEALEAGEVQVHRHDGSFMVHYADHAMPVAPPSLDGLLASVAEDCDSDELAFIAESLTRLPASTSVDRRSATRRHRDKEILRRHLARLFEEDPAVAAAADRALAALNTDPDALDGLLERQNYRLAFWRAGGQELDYRRFFDVDALVALRSEDERVFADTHQLLLDLHARGAIAGFRIDHIDGLQDPEGYLDRLKRASGAHWIVVEKVLEDGERLPDTWPVAGTTGYEFLALVNGLFVDPASEGPLSEVYREFAGESHSWEEVVRTKKHLVMQTVLASDINRLTALFIEVCERHRRLRDYTRVELREGLREVIACLRVYRTYVDPAGRAVSEQDRRFIEQAASMARELREDVDPQLIDFLRRVLLLEVRGAVESQLVSRFQQVTGPVMAKGVEDTAFYCFNRMVMLNEVGGTPGRFAISPADFHAENVRRNASWPRSLLATSTHDTKRSEDVRARLALLSEIPENWNAAVKRWATMNSRHRRDGWPDSNSEYLFYQTVVGAWPLDAERAVAYMQKATREAKVHTSWINPNAEFDAALKCFVEAVSQDREFQEDLEAFVGPLVWPGRINSLAQTLLKLTAPGIPDIYQGTELWDLSLVDPDNRRAVDYDLRRRMLDEAGRLSAEEALARADEGLPKLWLTFRALRLRSDDPALFAPGAAYDELGAVGPARANVVAFMRGGRSITIVPRLGLSLNSHAGTTIALPRGRWRNQLADGPDFEGTVAVDDLFAAFPVALLSMIS